jgi:hypothetical protein
MIRRVGRQDGIGRFKCEAPRGGDRRGFLHTTRRDRAMGDEDDTSATSAGKLAPEQKLPEEMARARALIEAAANPGSRGRTPLDQLILDLARARPRWDDEAQDPKANRECLIGYLEAFHAFLVRYDLNGAADLTWPLAQAVGALRDLQEGKAASWLKPVSFLGTHASARHEMVRRALLAAAADRYLQAGLGLELGCKEIGAVAGVPWRKIEGWRKQILREDEKRALGEEREEFERRRAWFADKSPADLPDIVRIALEGPKVD